MTLDAGASSRTHTQTGLIGMHATVSFRWQVPRRAVHNECSSIYGQSVWRSSIHNSDVLPEKEGSPGLLALALFPVLAALLGSCPACLRSVPSNFTPTFDRIRAHRSRLLISGKIEEKLQFDWNRLHVLQAKREKVLAYEQALRC